MSFSLKQNYNKTRDSKVKNKTKILNTKIEYIEYINKKLGHVIPKHIYQTWNTKTLPFNMENTINNLKRNNPEFEHHLFDNDDCREFIKNNFNKIVLWAYDSLVPGAYKADLWRYCILYARGGIYLDIKYEPVGNFRLDYMIYSEHYTKDIRENDIYNAFLVCYKKNPVMLACIEQIIINVQNNFYGKNALFPTGPGLLGVKIPLIEQVKQKKIIVDLDHQQHGEDKYIFHKNKPILKMYAGYYQDLYSNKDIPRYDTLWNARSIYRYVEK